MNYAGILFLICYLFLPRWICSVIGNWGIFKKAGEPGWKTLIPFYGNYLSYKISWRGDMYFIWIATLIVSCVLLSVGTGAASLAGMLVYLGSFGIIFIRYIRLSAAFQHGIAFALGLIFLYPVFILILGYDRSVYNNPQPACEE